MPVSAASHFRWRSEPAAGWRWWLGVVLLATTGLTACPRPAPELSGDIRQADASWVTNEVVAELRERDSLDETTAREQAYDTLRLARARLRELEAAPTDSAGGSELSPAHLDNLQRRSLAHLWLRERFERDHGADDIPQRLVDDNLNAPQHFHPQLHALCNIMVVPDEKTEDGSPSLAPDSPAWRQRAERVLTTATDRLKAWLPDPATEKSCTLLKRLVGLHERSYDDGQLRLRIESGVMDVCRRDRWDPGFVDALCGPADRPGWYGPFITRYGVHTVAVLELKPVLLPDDGERQQIVRDKMVTSWRTQELEQLLARARQAEVTLLDRATSTDGAPQDP